MSSLPLTSSYFCLVNSINYWMAKVASLNFYMGGGRSFFIIISNVLKKNRYKVLCSSFTGETKRKYIFNENSSIEHQNNLTLDTFTKVIIIRKIHTLIIHKSLNIFFIFFSKIRPIYLPKLINDMNIF